MSDVEIVNPEFAPITAQLRALCLILSSYLPLISAMGRFPLWSRKERFFHRGGYGLGRVGFQ